MKNFPRYLLLSLVFLISFSACSGFKSAKNTKKYFTLNEATSQRTIPGIRQGAITTQYHFVITWESTDQPESFFWKGVNTWMNCKVYRLHKLKDSDGEEINLDQIRKGDILSLVPIIGGKFPIPHEINLSLNDVIIFKTNKSKWQEFEVKALKKLPDLILP